jgi:hypothetical protein
LQKQVNQKEKSQMANPLKGEIPLTLGSETYKCRLTIDALVRIEDELDKGILELATAIAEAKVRIRTLIVVLRHALRGGGNDYDDKKVGEIISSVGIVVASTEVAKLLVATLTDNDPNEEVDKKKVVA